jgi:hypothetical protein
MISLDSQQLESYVPVFDAIPMQWDDARPFIVEQMKKMSNAINIREIGWFLDEELLSGKAFIPGVNIQGNQNSQQFRQILRIVINFGTLPNNTTKSVPHGIIFDSNFTLIEMWISATDPINFKAFSLQYWANSGPGSIILNMDATNVNVTTTSNYSAYTRSYVIIEYIQEL